MSKKIFLFVLMLPVVVLAEVSSQARWIWCSEPIVESYGQYRFFRHKINLPSEPVSGTIYAACDDAGAVYINGKCNNWRCGVSDSCEIPAVGTLKKGENIIAFQGYNVRGYAGILLRGEITLADGTKVLIVTDRTWKCSKEKQNGWTDLKFDDSKWVPATDLRGVNANHIWKKTLKKRQFFLSEKEFQDDANEAKGTSAEPKKVSSQARWIWCSEPIVESYGQYRFFRHKINLPSEPVSGTIYAACDDAGAVYINGKFNNWRCGVSDSCEIPAVGTLKKGENIIAFQGYNVRGYAGILLRGEITLADGTKVLIVTDRTWKCSKEKQNGWTDLNFDDSKWVPATDLRGVNANHIWKKTLKKRQFFLSEKEFRDDANEAKGTSAEPKK